MSSACEEPINVKEKVMPRKIQTEHIDKDNPEADAQWFSKARPAKEVLPELLGPKKAQSLLTPKRGRPPLQTTKNHINLRLDADVVARFKETGRGWQTRMNLALREWLTAHNR